MTPSDRVARRSHGIQQHGGGGAVGRLVPLPAGKRTCGVGGGGGGGSKELQACDLQGLFVLRPLALSALPWAQREPCGWGVVSAEAGPGVPERNSWAGAERAGWEVAMGGARRGVNRPILPDQTPRAPGSEWWPGRPVEKQLEVRTPRQSRLAFMCQVLYRDHFLPRTS